ncbi:hypothetical protein C8J57DRAFT_1570401 [Mycena rebaudengoi]|nr:hypothetical protein C8J57DRAFT_1570401 [Mycena rebaudengoi]
MRFPRELVDIVIDEVARLGDSSSERTLRACSLTARSFQLRSQLHLFTRIGRHRHPKDLMKFDGLLAGSPHIGKLVRYLTLDLKGNAPVQLHEKMIVVPRILRLLPSLTHLQFALQCDSGHSWALQPDLLKTSIHAALSLHRLRNLCVTDMKFADVSELESLLSHAIGLKALTLNNIEFHPPLGARMSLANRISSSNPSDSTQCGIPWTPCCPVSAVSTSNISGSWC